MSLVYRVKLLLCLVAFICSCVGQMPTNEAQVAQSISDIFCSPAAKLLPCEEASALAQFLNGLEGLPTELFITRRSCDENVTYISCNCSVHPKDTQCHVDSIEIGSDLTVSGEIDKVVAQLEYLTKLDLSDNQLFGRIPESLGNLSRLQILDIGSNELSGPIPPCLGKLSSLTSLDLGFNFLNGTIPPALGKLSSLQALDMSYNNLSGPIPKELGNLRNLTYLSLAENQLSGSLPSSLSNLTKLESFGLESNNLTGGIPSTYASLRSLESIDLSGNRLGGPIPSFIANWNSLEYLELRGNQFESIAREIFGMSSLIYLVISDVPIKGNFQFPDLSALTNLTKLILRNCSITGPIHPSIYNLSHNLTKLDLSHNNLTGDLSALGNLTSYCILLLTSNQLGGSIPSKLLGRQNDTTLRDFSDNDFTNDGNEEHGNLTYIKPDRSTINSTRALRKQHCHKRKSKYHSLFINCGGGQVEIGNRVYQADNSTLNFEIYDGWGYSCSGSFANSVSLPLPSYYIQNSTCGVPGNYSELYNEARLCPTSLRYFAFCLHKGNYTVTLHFRDTVFATDQDYSSLGKRVFDVYINGNRSLTDFYVKENNNRPGNVSEQSFEAQVHGDGLLDIYLYWAGIGSGTYPTALHGPLISAISITPILSPWKPWKIAVIAVACFLALILLLLFVLWRTGLIGDRDLREKSIHIRGRDYTIKQVVDATKRFSPKAEISIGSFGTLYKAELPNGPVVAVKKLAFSSEQVKSQIESEAYTLKQLKHEHIVELFGGYSNARKDLHLLVYEFMEHKSVGEALFDPNCDIELKWVNRYEICCGMAKGLHYLHTSRFKIVHRNINANIILLDANLKAKVSDLGLAKLQEEENPYFAVGAGGALVYMAPEYATRKAISDKVDVYSFGVVLLEIVSGKNNADYSREGQEAEFLLEKACVLQTKGRLMDLVDGRLLSDHTYDRNQARKVLDLAMLCVDQSATLRPTMSEVVAVLEDQLSLEQLTKQNG